MSNSGNVSAAVIEALCTMSDGDYTTAAEQWRALLSPTESRHRHGQDGGDQDPASEQEQAEDQVKAGEEGVTTALTTGTADGNYLDSNATKGKEMIKHNLAVCLLYTGKIDEARSILESMLEEDRQSFHTLTFNLATIYELCSSDGTTQKLKLGMAEKVAAMAPSLSATNAAADGREVGIPWQGTNADYKL